MLSFRVRSSSLFEPEHSRFTPCIPFALLDMIQHMLQPFQVRHEQPAEGARVAHHDQPGLLDVRFNPSAFLLPDTPFNAGVCHSTPNPVFSVGFLMKAHFIHGFQYLLL